MAAKRNRAPLAAGPASEALSSADLRSEHSHNRHPFQAKNGIAERRVATWRNDWDVIPVFGKETRVPSWQTFVDQSEDRVRSFKSHFSNIHHPGDGVVAERAPGLDIDVLDSTGIALCLAIVRNRFRKLGRIIFRVGRPPKSLVPFKLDGEPFGKLWVQFAPRNGSEKGERLELLARGNFYATMSTHPGTGQPYKWFGGDPTTVRRDDLPPLDRAGAISIMADCAEALEKLGYDRTGDNITPKPQRSTTAFTPTPRPTGSLVHPSIERFFDCDIAELASAREGARHETLKLIAGRVVRQIRLGNVDERHGVAELTKAAQSTGLPDRQIETLLFWTLDK